MGAALSGAQFLIRRRSRIVSPELCHLNSLSGTPRKQRSLIDWGHRTEGPPGIERKLRVVPVQRHVGPAFRNERRATGATYYK
jgi:hypothetical protein